MLKPSCASPHRRTGTFITGPCAGMMLADLERTHQVEARTRQYRSYKGSVLAALPGRHRNKRQLVCDLSSRPTRAFRTPIVNADVYIQNFRPARRNAWPGTKRSGPQPKLVYADSGFAPTAPTPSGRADWVARACRLPSVVVDPERPRFPRPALPTRSTASTRLWNLGRAARASHRARDARRGVDDEAMGISPSSVRRVLASARADLSDRPRLGRPTSCTRGGRCSRPTVPPRNSAG